ncbi:MAG: T9SS type A sorting domain-containing protein [bacterium]
MVNLLLLTFLFNGFVQKWTFQNGIYATAGRMCIGDTDRDGHYELIFCPNSYPASHKIHIYELHLPNTWVCDSFPYFFSPLLWDIGDFDLDGLFDLVTEVSINSTHPAIVKIISESPDSFSYPTQEVWRNDTVGPPAGGDPIAAYDVDKDGIPEILIMVFDVTKLQIFESIGNNQYDCIYADTIHSSSTYAFGDFDCDDNIEFVRAWDRSYWIYESPANNTYEKIAEGQLLSTGNIKDCFTVPDADGDGRLEFVLKGYSPSTGRIETFFFEAIGNDTYTIIDSFTFYNGHPFYSGGHSTAGDIDGDNIPEIVLEACQDIYIIKSAGNDSFYVWETLPGHNTGSDVRVFDFDNNGLNEILISGNNETHIYEYEPGAVEEHTLGKPVNISFTCLPNVVENDIYLSFTLPQQTQVSLNIYNNLGQRVRSISTGTQSAGCHSQKIDLTAFTAGVYFVQLKTQDQVIIQKVVKIK